MRSLWKGQEIWPRRPYSEYAALPIGLRIIGVENNLSVMPSPDVYWLALRRVHGVGPRTCKLLIDKFGAPEKIFQLDADRIAAAGVPRNTARSIAEFRDFDPLEKELCELPNIGARLVKWTDADYPSNF